MDNCLKVIVLGVVWVQLARRTTAIRQDPENSLLKGDVLKALDKDPEAFDKDVQQLMEWTYTQPHLPNITDKALATSFVISTPSPERARKSVDKYFSDRNSYLFLQDRDPSKIPATSLTKATILGRLTPGLESVNLMRSPGDAEDRFNLDDFIKFWFMLLDVELLERPYTTGHVLALDLATFSWGALSQLSVGTVSQILDAYQEYPLRLSKLVLFNTPWIFKLFYNTIIRNAYNFKLSDKIHVLSEGAEALKDFMPQDMLPQDYGGSEPTLDKLFKESYEKVVKERDWFLGEGSARTDESRRL